MLTNKAEIEGKPGVKELEHDRFYFVIANRFLYEHGRSTKYAVVDTQRKGVDEVYSTVEAATAALNTHQ